jgi:dCTP deaminase
MTLDLNTKNPGFVCRKTDTVLDLSKRNHYDPKSFFETVQVRNGGLVLEPGAFYILSTKEVLDIPGNICGEMETSSYKLGEFRAHYAGFFDPGFKAFGTLEVRSSEELFVYDGYPITEMVFEKTSTMPEVLYGDKKTVHYQGQVGPTLSKHFKK